MNPNSAFETSLAFSQKILSIKRSHLSLAQHDSIKEKDLLTKKHTTKGRLTADEHVGHLINDGLLVDQGQPLLVLSARNVLANLRCIGYVRDRTPRPIGVTDERFDSTRPFHILGARTDGRHTIEQWDGREPVPHDCEWFVSGIPVLWDDESEAQLFTRLVPEAADHSHVWRIHRGNHPLATPETLAQWSALHEIFLSTLASGREEAFEKLNAHAQREGLQREDGILHNIIGLDAEGNFLQLIAIGRLEELGRRLRRLGAIRALCLDNSGSCVVRYRPAAKPGATAAFIQLVAAPNHRPPGTAYLALELGLPGFAVVNPG